MHYRLILSLLVTLFFTGILQAQSNTDSLIHPDSIALPEPVMIFADHRLAILELRAAKLEAEERARAHEKQTIQGKAIVSQDGKKKVTGSIFTAKGYRIIIYNGPDRNQAIKAKNEFSKNFNGYRSYMSYNVPSYKIKVGDFEGKSEANDFLRRVSRQFPSSFIVPDIVTIKNINVSE